MEIKQFKYASDNFGYLVYNGGEAMAIDGGAVAKILSFVKEQNLDLKFITNTHGHGDHTMGTQDLVRLSGGLFLDYKKFKDQDTIDLGDEAIMVLHTPGHTTDDITFFCDGFLVTGDTLFNGTVGNCFSGDLGAFYHSIKKLMAMPPDVKIYAGHDYVRESMVVAKNLDPDNGFISEYLEKIDHHHLFSTLADELTVNPYLRFNEKSLIALMKKEKLPTETEYQRWESIMSLG